MNQHYSGEGSGTQWSRVVGVDYLSIMARQHSGLGKHSLIHVSRIRMHGPALTHGPDLRRTKRTRGLRSVNSLEEPGFCVARLIRIPNFSRASLAQRILAQIAQPVRITDR